MTNIATDMPKSVAIQTSLQNSRLLRYASMLLCAIGLICNKVTRYKQGMVVNDLYSTLDVGNAISLRTSTACNFDQETRL